MTLTRYAQPMSNSNESPPAASQTRSWPPVHPDKNPDKNKNPFPVDNPTKPESETAV